MSQKASPPRPVICGYTTHNVAPAAMAASTALPPRRRVPKPRRAGEVVRRCDQPARGKCGRPAGTRSIGVLGAAAATTCNVCSRAPRYVSPRTAEFERGLSSAGLRHVGMAAATPARSRAVAHPDAAPMRSGQSGYGGCPIGCGPVHLDCTPQIACGPRPQTMVRMNVLHQYGYEVCQRARGRRMQREEPERRRLTRSSSG